MYDKKIKTFFRKNGIWLILFLSVISFLALAEDVFTNEIMHGDRIGYDFIAAYLINDTLTPVVKGITWFGSGIPFCLITCLLFLFMKNKRIGICIGTNLVLITILNQAFKFIFQRPRPTEYQIINAAGYSFPSGHSMISLAFYGYLIYLIYRRVSNKSLKWSLITILSLLILLIGFSRIYLGVHYVSDVIAGFAVSVAYLILFIRVTHTWSKEQKDEK